MKRAAIYVRDNMQDKTRVDVQVRACEDYADKNGYRITKKYVADTTRPSEQLDQMINDVNKDMYDVILVHQYDRITRNVSSFAKLGEHLNNNHVRLVSITQEDTVSPMLNIMAMYLNAYPAASMK